MVGVFETIKKARLIAAKKRQTKRRAFVKKKTQQFGSFLGDPGASISPAVKSAGKGFGSMLRTQAKKRGKSASIFERSPSRFEFGTASLFDDRPMKRKHMKKKKRRSGGKTITIRIN